MMIHCWECGESISSSAAACPKCGASQNRVPDGAGSKAKAAKPRVKYYTFIFVVAIALLCVTGLDFINSFTDLAYLTEFDLFLLEYLAIGATGALFVVLILNLIFITQVKREELSISVRFGFSRTIFSLTIAVIALALALLGITAAICFSVASFAVAEELPELMGTFTSSLIFPGAFIGIYIPTLIKTIHYNGNIKKQYLSALAQAQATA